MATVDTLRNNLIEKLLTISNKDYLLALTQLVDTSAVEKHPFKLTASQIEMLKLSEEDIKAGRLISHEEVVKADREWLKSL
jgi:hypothetical protein